MFDVILKNDLLNLNKADNINNLTFNRKEITKIIRNRTQEKLLIINFLFSNNLIDADCYQELLKRTENDYRKANLYLIGLCNI